MNSQTTAQGRRPGIELEPEQTEAIDVYCWRMEQLLQAGFTRVLADALAVDAGVDLHAACDLLAAGCPQAVAYRIVS